MQKIAILGSGTGSNCEQIIKHFRSSKEVEVALLLTNNTKSGLIRQSSYYNIPCIVFEKKEFSDSTILLKSLVDQKINWIVLAGFLWLIPKEWIRAFPDKIINIHPALLPKYGGKGMYGSRIHQAVIENKEKESGITIHFVNEHYDEGAIIFQKEVKIQSNETPETLQKKIHGLEHKYFPKVIEKLILSTSS